MRKTAILLVALAFAARAGAQDPAADAAASQFLATPSLASTKAPAEQWYASYAGACWTGAVRISVVDKDEAAAGLRRIEIEEITGREKDNPARELDKWWVDGRGVVARGERHVFGAGEEDATITRIDMKGGKLNVREDGGKAEEPKDIPAAFVPDKLIAIVFLPDKRATYRFSTLGRDEFAYFTVEDMGKEMVSGRSGDASARKLRVKDKDGEAFYWVDGDRRVVSVKWSSNANLLAVGGTEEECRTDWWARPADDLDAAGDDVAKGSAKLDSLVGEMTYGIYTPENHLKARVKTSFKKTEKDGKPAYHYESSTAEVGSNATSAVEDWWYSADGKLLSASYKAGEVEAKLRVDGDKLVATEGKEEATLPIPPRFVPDSLLLVKAAASGKTSFRFYSFDLAAKHSLAYLLAPSSDEEISLPGSKAKVKAKRVDLTQNVAEARAWVDANGKLLLVIWNEDTTEGGDICFFAPLDKLPDTIEEYGPPDKEKGGD